MSNIHEALQSLAPVDFATVPSSASELGEYMQKHFAKAQVLIESVPPPSSPDLSISSSRSRSNTTSSATSSAEIIASSVRSSPLIPAHASLQKDWGKPMKLGKDNSLGMGVYKLSSKDGKGAWFARRSVHEGLGFDKWKAALIREFPESLEVKGSPGEGNIRGIGGEERLERKVIEGVGSMEVYHLSAQFPGPTTPRDFVTLLLTSSEALQKADDEKTKHTPRHYMVMSKPCKHPKTEPPASGFIRGQYESVEIIREVVTQPKQSSSAIDLSQMKDKSGEDVDLSKTAVLKRAHDQAKTNDGLGAHGDKIIEDSSTEATEAAMDAIHDEARSRGKTISFAESRGATAKGENLDKGAEEEPLPVEWIMLTRSDPGGSVPRFMVERGTPSSICGDAVKFLDWACAKDIPIEGELPRHRASLDVTQLNGHLSEINKTVSLPDKGGERHVSTAGDAPPADPDPSGDQSGFLSNLASAAYLGIETYAPKAVSDRLPGNSASTPNLAPPDPTLSDDASSIVSFASADSHFSSDSDPDSKSTKSIASTKGSLTSSDKQLAKLHARKAKLDAKLQKAREREVRDKEALSEKEAARIRKAEDKHAREIAKAEERHQKELKSLEQREQRENRKEEERRDREEKRSQEKKDKTEKEGMRAEIETLKAERDLLRESVKKLQGENTKLVAVMGRVDGGKGLLEEVRKQSEEGARSRSSSSLSTRAKVEG